MDAQDRPLDPGTAPPPDAASEPAGFVVLVEPNDRIHFLDWGGPDGAPGVLLVHGIGATAWTWAPVVRRLLSARRTIAMDLRGHGLSDAPTDGYDPGTLAEDAVAVADGAGLLEGSGVVLAGHGLGAMVAAQAAARLGPACAGLVLVDGGFEATAAATGLEPEELLRSLDEPPEVLRSMDAFLADREAFDPPTWDDDQQRAARASVVELPVGRVVPVTRPHVLAGMVGAMYAYDPEVVLPSIECPIAALVAGPDEAGVRAAALERAQGVLAEAGRPPMRIARLAGDGHNLMRYRPAEVTSAILGVAERRFFPR